MHQRSVGDFLANLAAPNMEPIEPPAVPPVPVVEGAPPIDEEKIKGEAGAKDVEKNIPKKPELQIDPMLLKEIEIIHLKLRLVDTEEQLLVQKIQEIRQQRKALLRIQQQLVVRAKGQIIVGPNGELQPAPR